MENETHTEPQQQLQATEPHQQLQTMNPQAAADALEVSDIQSQYADAPPPMKHFKDFAEYKFYIPKPLIGVDTAARLLGRAFAAEQECRIMKEMSEMQLKYAQEQEEEYQQRLNAAREQLLDVVEAIRYTGMLPIGFFSSVVTAPYVVKIEGDTKTVSINGTDPTQFMMN